SVTDDRSRRASLQARAMSASTCASGFGKGELTGEESWVLISSSGCRILRSFEFYPILERLLEPLPVPCCPGARDQDVERQFQPQARQTQGSAGNPRPAGLAGADP